MGHGPEGDMWKYFINYDWYRAVSLIWVCWYGHGSRMSERDSSDHLLSKNGFLKLKKKKDKIARELFWEFGAAFQGQASLDQLKQPLGQCSGSWGTLPELCQGGDSNGGGGSEQWGPPSLVFHHTPLTPARFSPVMEWGWEMAQVMPESAESQSRKVSRRKYLHTITVGKREAGSFRPQQNTFFLSLRNYISIFLNPDWKDSFSSHSNEGAIFQ